MYIFCFVCFRQCLFNLYYEYFRMIRFSRLPLLIIPHVKSIPGLKCSKCPFPPTPPPPFNFTQNGCLNSPRRRLVSINFVVDLRVCWWWILFRTEASLVQSSVSSGSGGGDVRGGGRGGWGQGCIYVNFFRGSNLGFFSRVSPTRN